MNTIPIRNTLIGAGIAIALGISAVGCSDRAPAPAPKAQSENVAEAERIASDTWITTKVKSMLLADDISKGFDVKVDTRDGVVVLTGALNNEDAIKHVRDIAADVEGVKSVDTSNLKVSGKY